VPGVQQGEPTVSTDTWVDWHSDPGTGHFDRTAFQDRMLDLFPSGSLSWSDTLLLPQIHHFKDRVVLGTYYVFSFSPSFVPLDTKTILEKRDLTAGPYGSALSRAYCMSTSSSYPGMMCRDSRTLSPFIHLQSRPSPSRIDSGPQVTLPEPTSPKP
jgi:hypothetical protein